MIDPLQTIVPCSSGFAIPMCISGDFKSPFICCRNSAERRVVSYSFDTMKNLQINNKNDDMTNPMMIIPKQPLLELESSTAEG